MFDTVHVVESDDVVYRTVCPVLRKDSHEQQLERECRESVKKRGKIE